MFTLAFDEILPIPSPSQPKLLSEKMKVVSLTPAALDVLLCLTGDELAKRHPPAAEQIGRRLISEQGLTIFDFRCKIQGQSKILYRIRRRRYITQPSVPTQSVHWVK
jgi:hypothetical protein